MQVHMHFLESWILASVAKWGVHSRYKQLEDSSMYLDPRGPFIRTILGDKDTTIISKNLYEKE